MSEIMDFKQTCRELIKRGEGCISHMYLDTVGKVTVGVGNMLPTIEAATGLPFHNRETGNKASEDEIKHEYETVAGQKPAMAATSYKQYTTLDLSDEYIDELLDKRIAEFETGLKKDFQNYEQYPGAAKLGLMDMAFNLGNSGLINKFPSFTRAARAQNWQGCAEECDRRGISDERNDEVKKLFGSIT